MEISSSYSPALNRESTRIFQSSPVFQPNGTGACPVDVSQLARLNLIDDCDCHVFVIDTAIYSCFLTTLIFIDVDLILASSESYSQNQLSRLFMLRCSLVYNLYTPLSRRSQGGERKLHWTSVTPSHIDKAIREQSISPMASGSVNVFFAETWNNQANILPNQENPVRGQISKARGPKIGSWTPYILDSDSSI